VVSPGARRAVMKYLIQEHKTSERKACKIVQLCRSSGRYKMKKDAEEDELYQRIKAIVEERRRFGYRRIGYLLMREGYRINHK
jgi:putative transposase